MTLLQEVSLGTAGVLDGPVLSQSISNVFDTKLSGNLHAYNENCGKESAERGVGGSLTLQSLYVTKYCLFVEFRHVKRIVS
jgi:hypothetical protein